MLCYVVFYRKITHLLGTVSEVVGGTNKVGKARSLGIPIVSEGTFNTK